MMTQQFTPECYQQQLEKKTTHLSEIMAEFNPPAMQVFSSPISHYRMRAEFHIWHEDESLFHIMFDKQTRQRIKIEQFPVASQLINQAMQALTDEIKNNHLLRYKLFQVDYLSTLSNQLIISLLYHKKLDETWQSEAQALRNRLITQGFNVQIVGRAAKQKFCLDDDFVEEKLLVDGKEIIYRQVESSFTQPNAAINIKMLEWALAVTQHANGDLLELYCGNGNFSLALARNFRQVLATEIAKSSVHAAQYNIAANHIDNVKILRMSAEEFTQALQGVRVFKRLNGVNLNDYHCETVLVDPPRSGLDDQTLNMISDYETIIYISCNPITLKNNLVTLTKTHRIEKMAMFDQFPYTEHMECGVVLKKQS